MDQSQDELNPNHLPNEETDPEASDVSTSDAAPESESVDVQTPPNDVIETIDETPGEQIVSPEPEQVDLVADVEPVEVSVPPIDESPEEIADDEAPFEAPAEPILTEQQTSVSEETPVEVGVEVVAADVEGSAASIEGPSGNGDGTSDVAVADQDEAEDLSLLDWQPGEWFVVHTYAGYENKVKTNLESRIISMNMEEKIYEVVIPVEDVMEVKSGKKQVVQRKVFPGYLLVRMDLDDDSWYVVRNTPGVTGFVGSGTKPIPLSDREVDRVLQRKGAVEERPKPKLEFSSGDNVRVVTGPFANFQGIISEIDVDRSKLKVLVNIFGRETPVELGFDQVSKV